jgi:hypothetical protein
MIKAAPKLRQSQNCTPNHIQNLQSPQCIRFHAVRCSMTWLTFIRNMFSSTKASPPEKVVLHDPASQKPHDLDDPFFDHKVQARVGEAIAKAARKK